MDSFQKKLRASQLETQRAFRQRAADRGLFPPSGPEKRKAEEMAPADPSLPASVSFLEALPFEDFAQFLIDGQVINANALRVNRRMVEQVGRAAETAGFFRKLTTTCFPKITRLPEDMTPERAPGEYASILKNYGDIKADNYLWRLFFLRLFEIIFSFDVDDEPRERQSLDALQNAIRSGAMLRCDDVLKEWKITSSDPPMTTYTIAQGIRLGRLSDYIELSPSLEGDDFVAKVSSLYEEWKKSGNNSVDAKTLDGGRVSGNFFGGTVVANATFVGIARFPPEIRTIFLRAVFFRVNVDWTASLEISLYPRKFDDEFVATVLFPSVLVPVTYRPPRSYHLQNLVPSVIHRPRPRPNT